jgi:hypothetical protein
MLARREALAHNAEAVASGGADEPLMGRCAWARIEKGQALWKNHASCTAVETIAWWRVYVAV